MANLSNVIEELHAGAIDVNDVDGAGVIIPGLMAKVRAALEAEALRALGEGEEVFCETTNESCCEHCELFANAGSEEVCCEVADSPTSPSVLLLRDYCLRPWGSSCTRCEMLCPGDAITLAAQGLPSIDQDRCLGCGVCSGACDAFVLQGFALPDLRRRLQMCASRFGEVILTSTSCVSADEDYADNVVVLPSLGMLSAEFLACLLTESISVVIAGEMSDLFDERQGGVVAEVLLSEAVAAAEAWTGRSIDYRESIPNAQETVGLKTEVGDNRREFLDALMTLLMADDARGSEIHEDTSVEASIHHRVIVQRHAISGVEVPRVNTYMPGGRFKQTLWPKRRLLLEACYNQPAIEECVTLQISTTDPAGCNDCLACVTACPSKARFAHRDDGLLEFDGRWCMGCSLCVSACPTQAITMEVLLPADAVATE